LLKTKVNHEYIYHLQPAGECHFFFQGEGIHHVYRNVITIITDQEDIGNDFGSSKVAHRFPAGYGQHFSDGVLTILPMNQLPK